MAQTTASHSSTGQETDELYMRRCLQLARCGRENANPNPMVGAVIVSADGRIIGEGYHVRCGEGHAEVNAFASVKPEDEALLKDATIYVSLEPCAHYGRTPPCCDLIIRKGVRRCVCGCVDPFAKVQGRGIERMRQAGIEVTVGVLEKECQRLNRRFFSVNTLGRPYIILKWAQTANGRMDQWPADPLRISNAFTHQLVHKLRAEADAILVGRGTLDHDHPQLTVRAWSGKDPVRLVLTHVPNAVPEGFHAFNGIDDALRWLQQERKQSLIVEGGAETLHGFLERDLWDEIRVETAPFSIAKGTRAPQLPPTARLAETHVFDGNIIARYERDDDSARS